MDAGAATSSIAMSRLRLVRDASQRGGRCGCADGDDAECSLCNKYPPCKRDARGCRLQWRCRTIVCGSTGRRACRRAGGVSSGRSRAAVHSGRNTIASDHTCWRTSSRSHLPHSGWCLQRPHLLHWHRHRMLFLRESRTSRGRIFDRGQKRDRFKAN
jgi:hypothetical protein